MENKNTMSNIANEINRLLIEKNKTAADIARFCGFTDAHISRIKNGVQVWISADDLKNIAAAFTTGKGETYNKVHSRLLHAHLQDECHGPGAKYIHIELQGQPLPMILREDSEAKPVLPPKMQENLDIIAAGITSNRNVRDLVETAANILRGGSIPQPDSK